MKYGLIAVVIAIIGLFYFANQSNKADAERLKQAEIAHQQKLEQDKANELKAEQRLDAQRIQTEKSKAQKIEQDRLRGEASAREFAKKTEAEKAVAIKRAEDKVRSKLIDPDSAQFRNQKGNCGEVNAKNKLGGYTGYSRYIYDPENDHAVVESDASTSIITPEIMNVLWSSSCS